MKFDKPATRWTLAVVASLVALAFEALPAPAQADPLRSLPFLLAVAAVALLAGRAPAVFTLAFGVVVKFGPWLPGATPPVVPGMSRPATLLGFVVVGGLLIYVAQQARHYSREWRRARVAMDLALAAADVGSWSYDYTTREFRYSDNVGPMMGRDAGFVHDSLEDWQRDVHPDDYAALDESLRAAGEGGTYEVKYRVRTPAGDYRWLLVRARRTQDANGRLSRADGIVMDVTIAQLDELDRWRRSKEFETLLDLVPAGIAVAHDPRCDRITASPGLEKMLGISGLDNLSSTGDERDRLPYRCMRDGRELPGEQLPMQVAARSGREVRDVEFDVVFTADGRVMSLLVSAAPLFDADGQVRGAIGVHVDITALKQAQHELERVARQKDVFLATLAHELRNPLAPVRYAAALLRPGVSPEVIDEARRVIERQTGQMSQLLDELLDVSRITRDVVDLKHDRVDFRHVVLQEIAGLRPQLAELRHEIHVEMPAPQAWVEGDATRLHQVVSNLLSNAAKYTDPGGRIRVRLDCDDRNVTLRVKDSGIGIAPENLTRVFDLFSQVRQPGASSRGGLGIGLAVVRRLVELHGGRIRAASDGPGRGAEFSVQLPLVESQPQVAPTPAAAPIERPPLPLRVLVVDDNADAAEVLGSLLQARGMDVQIAYDGASATLVADRLQPEVVILDLGLPDLPGDEVARWIRRRPWGAGTCVIAVTGWGQAQDRARTAAAGFDHHLVKPVDPGQLLGLIEHRLRKDSVVAAGRDSLSSVSQPGFSAANTAAS